MLDRDLAALYGVKTKRLNEVVIDIPADSRPPIPVILGHLS